MSSLRITSIGISSCLVTRRERKQRDVTRLLDRVGEPPLVRGAHARDAAGDDLAALGHEGVKHLHVLIVDVVDLLDAEPANFLAPEISLLSACDRLIATGGARTGAHGPSSTTTRFGHGLYLPFRLARHGAARYWCWWFGHHLRHRRLRRRGRCRSIRCTLGGTLVAGLLALFQA